MSNVPKTHDNTSVQRFLDGYYSANDLARDYPEADDILSGVLELKTMGDTSTRSMSRQVLFHVLQWCPAITVASINTATNGSYAYATLARYAALARIASKSLEVFAERLPEAVRRLSIKEARRSLDALYDGDLQEQGLA